MVGVSGSDQLLVPVVRINSKCEWFESKVCVSGGAMISDSVSDLWLVSVVWIKCWRQRSGSIVGVKVFRIYCWCY